ncbi:Ig-like protein group 2 [Mobilisporobacter senegalensis]|uniref:Ig-like protein group 2 n=1 Tax=Mobilisporobacter senegalensis TaxID=1329262 RepID=A0A3N1XZS4_9FIRM|nr:Ig-like domain-containing protein [Mobilisporobacter senegalensis]ROR31778.1 Ig-like protein group 2 [Mobilisporobacter senegalensis]
MSIKDSVINHSISNKRFIKIISLCLVFSLMVGLCLQPTKYVYAKEKFQGILIEEELLVMKEGDKYKLKPCGYNYINVSGTKLMEVDDISNVKWKSSNTKVATVNTKGEVTAKKSGKCTITATWGKKKAVSKIRVYTEKQQYQYILDGDISHQDIYMALTTNKYKNYEEYLYDSGYIDTDIKANLKAAKKVKEIIDETITKDMSDYEKVMAIAAWLVENIEIDDTFVSDYADSRLRNQRKKSFYMDPLLYGKGTSFGFVMLFDLVLNVCGIRCEYVYDSYFTMADGESEYIYLSNVVELEGDFYYFNVISLAEDMKYYKKQGVKKSFNDLITPDSEFTKQFINIISLTEKEKLYEEGEDLRNTFYSTTQGDTNYIIVPLGCNTNKLSGMSHYFYDFYTNSIRYVTLKEKKKDIYPAVYFSSLPIYPDSTATKYREVIKELANKNGNVIN